MFENTASQKLTINEDTVNLWFTQIKIPFVNLIDQILRDRFCSIAG